MNHINYQYEQLKLAFKKWNLVSILITAYGLAYTLSGIISWGNIKVISE